ncbi:hypothetical protein BDW02DRAFT_198416 [Decorospora gaudefroyi]|uniref:Uncharacterized protein n=1 Tax=Decorospora gaudefroyi TaxID=184978 RepID=A0A6A5JYV0_9PLEO|nr:hypothetical protein BDW02DRAFT_198416 [Decorospora gaudefroyi]
MERHYGPVHDSIELRSAFGGAAMDKRMASLRDHIQVVRKNWTNDNSYDELVKKVQQFHKPENLTQEVALQLQRLLGGYRDYADVDLQRPIPMPSEQYPALELYCGKEGHDYIFRLMGRALREEEKTDDLMLALTTLLEFVTIDLYNLRLSQFGDPRFNNFQGVVYRGMSVNRRVIAEYRAVLAEPELAKRQFAVPLSLFSASTDEQIMLEFSKQNQGVEDRDTDDVKMHWEIHVHGVEPALLQAYQQRYPDSVVTTICALPVARVSRYGEKEVLLRGSFFHLIDMRSETLEGQDVVRLILLMINANRDHTSEQSSNLNEKARQRKTFSRIVAASKFEACAGIAGRFSEADASGYRRLQLAELEELKEVDDMEFEARLDLSAMRSPEVAVWLGGSLFKSHPTHYAEQRRSWQDALDREDWMKLLEILNRDYDWRQNDWFSVGRLYEDKQSNEGRGMSLLHKLASGTPEIDPNEEAFTAWAELVDKAADPAVWKSIHCHEMNEQTAEDIARSRDDADLQARFKPKFVHNVNHETLMVLQKQLHSTMQEHAGKFVWQRNSWALLPSLILSSSTSTRSGCPRSASCSRCLGLNYGYQCPICTV